MWRMSATRTTTGTPRRAPMVHGAETFLQHQTSSRGHIRHSAGRGSASDGVLGGRLGTVPSARDIRSSWKNPRGRASLRRADRRLAHPGGVAADPLDRRLAVARCRIASLMRRDQPRHRRTSLVSGSHYARGGAERGLAVICVCSRSAGCGIDRVPRLGVLGDGMLATPGL